MTLNEVKPGKTVTIRKLLLTGSMKKKMMDMGLTKNTEVYVRKVAPLGDPIELTVRGYELSIRKADASLIEVDA
ncbi:ferrous iron transport protein A [Erysipelotrichaceae bacterium HCN-30851]